MILHSWLRARGLRVVVDALRTVYMVQALVSALCLPSLMASIVLSGYQKSLAIGKEGHFRPEHHRFAARGGDELRFLHTSEGAVVEDAQQVQEMKSVGLWL